MLGRAAHHLFWMSRYLERVENTARLLRTCYLLDLMPRADREKAASSIWRVPLVCTGTLERFHDAYEEITRERVLAFMISDMDNASSVRSCLQNARENARATRHLLTSDIWGCVNQTWLTVKALTGRQLRRENIGDRLDWIVDRCYTFYGTFYGSMRRGEEEHFSHLGISLERAGHTCRYLCTFQEAARTSGEMERAGAGSSHPSRLHMATLMLRGMNSYKAYRDLYSANVTLEGISELLILEPSVPRSVRCCVEDITTVLKTLNPNCEGIQLVHDLHYRLQTVEMHHLRRIGLTGFLNDTVRHLDKVTAQVEVDFMMVQ